MDNQSKLWLGASGLLSAFAVYLFRKFRSTGDKWTEAKKEFEQFAHSYEVNQLGTVRNNLKTKQIDSPVPFLARREYVPKWESTINPVQLI